MAKTDGLDVAIIRALAYGPNVYQWDIRSPFARVGKELDVDENTVRNRVRALEEDGLIRGWHTVINPAMLDARMANLEIPNIASTRKEEAIEVLMDLDGIQLVFDYYRGGLHLNCFHHSPAQLQRLVDVVASICDAPTEAWSSPSPSLTIEPDRADWRLIQALRKAPKRPMAQLAEAAGVSVRTVQRRLPRLIEGRAVFVSLDTDLSRMTGRIPVHARVVLDDESRRSAVVKAMTRAGDVVFTHFDGDLLIVAYLLEGIGRLQAVETALGVLEGVAQARVDIQAQRLISEGWLDEAIAAKAGQM